MLYLIYLIILLSSKNIYSQISNLPSTNTQSFVLCTLSKNCSNVVGGLQIPTPQFILPVLAPNFTQLNTTSQYYVQTPYNLPVNNRFAIVNNTYDFFVYATDFPQNNVSSDHQPRSEYRSSYNFVNGTVLFEGFFKVSCNTTGFIFFQVFGLHAIFLMRTLNNTLVDYPYTKNICSNWHFLNVTLDINSQTGVTLIHSYLDNQLISNTSTVIPGPFIFKFGAYIDLSWNYTNRIESFYQNIRISTKGNVTYTGV